MSRIIFALTSAMRSLRRSPGFAAVTIATLGVGIGAATTVASVADHALLRPLPYRDADRLVTLLESDGRGAQRLASYPDFQDWRRAARSFTGMSFVRGASAILKGDAGAERITVAYVSSGHFATMGATPRLGRTFTADEELTDAGSAVVLSHEFWQRRFGGSPSALGQRMNLDVGSLTVIGVMPAGTMFPAWADTWRPMAAIAATDPALSQRGVRSDSRVVARLRDGVTPDAAAAEMRMLATRIAADNPAQGAEWTRVDLTPLRVEVVGTVAPMLLTLTAAVLLGLLIACVNVANLSFVRATARARDVAVRVALGAGRRTIVGGLLAESVVLAGAAGVLGIGITVRAVRAFRQSAPPGLPRADELGVDARVLAVALVLSLLTAVLCGLAPAIHSMRSDIASMLRDGRSSAMATRGGRRFQSALTVVQIGLAVVLLVGGGLLVKSFGAAQRVDVGFSPAGVLALPIVPPSPRYDSAAAAALLYEQLIDAAKAVPGVDAAAFVNHVPLSGASIPTRVRVAGRAEDTTGASGALYKTVTIDYLRVMRLPLLAGRWFTGSEFTSTATAVVISELVAKRYWPGENAVGRSITVFKSSQARADFGAPVTATVVGVVGSVRHFGVEVAAAPDVYVPYTSEPWPHGTLVVRTSLSAATVIPALRAAVVKVEPDLPIAGAGQRAGIQPLARSLDSLLATRRWMMTLVVAFAASALLLAALGIYGVTAYVVSQRTHEIGVRMALGATQRDVVRMVLRRGLLQATAGVVIGIAGAFALTRLIASLLFGTSPTEPTVFVAVPLVLTVVAAIACYLPARRAATVNPVVALRAE